MTVERVLCPVDFSDASRTALLHALALGHWYGAKVTVLHVFSEVPIVETTAAGLAIDVHAAKTPVEVAQIEERLHEFVSTTQGSAGATETVARVGAGVREAIIHQAVDTQADLIVLGSRGLTGLTRLVLGSTAESVLRHSTIPVLIVPPHAPKTPHPGVPFKRIVCAVDFEAESHAALHYAFDFAQQSDAVLTLLHVLRMPSRSASELGADVTLDEAHQTLTLKARSRLESLVPESARTYCSVHAHVTEGYPADEIVRLAKQGDADLIIMGLRGRDALDVALFGSYTRAVVHAASCPVLTVRQG